MLGRCLVWGRGLWPPKWTGKAVEGSEAAKERQGTVEKGRDAEKDEREMVGREKTRGER